MMQQAVLTRDKVRNAVRCPTCTAAPGEFCTTDRGQTRVRNHGERLLLAKKKLGSGDAAQTWWWTISRGGMCGSCSESVPVGTTIAYHHALEEALCEMCAES